MNTKTTKNKDLGWNDFFEAKKSELNLDDFVFARVVAQHKGLYRVKNENGEFLAKVTGKQMFDAVSQEDYPAVGDWVAVSNLDDERAVIQIILPRKSIIKRRFGDKNKTGEKKDIQVIATNIDLAFIVQAVGRDYNINRFERYLVLLKDEDIVPVMILNKTDLISTEELELKLMEIKNRLEGVAIVATSTTNNTGLIELKKYITRGKTCCFLGSSGVGKSTLINKLLLDDSIKTDNISAYSDRGRHTTTAREMYFLGNSGIVIDNPGIREVGLTDASVGVAELFSEIEELAKGCRYSDCTHLHEPGCEVLLALETGKLDKAKYSNYISLKKETEYSNMSQLEKREKDRQFGKFIKKAKKDFKNYKQKYF